MNTDDFSATIMPMYRNGHRHAAAQFNAMETLKQGTLAPNRVRCFFRTLAGDVVDSVALDLDKPAKPQIEQAWLWMAEKGRDCSRLVLTHD